MNLEMIVIGVVVLGTTVWAVRAGIRSVRTTGGCSSCATSGDCPAAKDPELLEKMVRGEDPGIATSCSDPLVNLEKTPR